MARDGLIAPGDASLARATALVDATVAGGVRHACLSPGSRSTPIALALARHVAITLSVHLDERSSAFVALGIAKATGRPAIVACTSGTAAAELFPAVVEASQARVPLLALTADRPPRLRGTGANQTIDQVELYGRYARRFLDAPLGGDPGAWAAVGRSALEAATAGLPGPVHVNLPFDEPLVPETTGIADRAVADFRSAVAAVTTHRDGSEPPVHAAVGEEELAPAAVLRAGRELDAERGLVVIGPMPAAPTRVVELAGRLGWPVIAEPTSGVRLPGRALAAAHHLIGSDRWIESHRPEVILQVGAASTTRATQRLVASAERLVVVDRAHLDADPDGRARWKLAADADALASALLTVVPAHPGSGSAAWAEAWRAADTAARTAIDGTLDDLDEPFEGRIARDVAAAVPDGGTLFVGNSMPVRDLDAFMAPREGVRVLANRGASGIDGLVSTTLGIAADAGPTVGLLGDLSLLHDVGALLWNGARDLDVVLVVPNNDGGGVFAFTGQAALPEFERLFATPHGLDLAAIADAARVPHAKVERGGDLVPALRDALGAGGIHLIEVPVDRGANVARHAAVQAAVDAVLA